MIELLFFGPDQVMSMSPATWQRHCLLRRAEDIAKTESFETPQIAKTSDILLHL